MYPIKVQSGYFGLQSHPLSAGQATYYYSLQSIAKFHLQRNLFQNPLLVSISRLTNLLDSDSQTERKKNRTIDCISRIYNFHVRHSTCLRRLIPLILASTLFLTWNTQKRVMEGGFLKQNRLRYFLWSEITQNDEILPPQGNLFRRCKRIIHELRSYTIRF